MTRPSLDQCRPPGRSAFYFPIPDTKLSSRFRQRQTRQLSTRLYSFTRYLPRYEGWWGNSKKISTLSTQVYIIKRSQSAFFVAYFHILPQRGTYIRPLPRDHRRATSTYHTPPHIGLSLLSWYKNRTLLSFSLISPLQNSGYMYHATEGGDGDERVHDDRRLR